MHNCIAEDDLAIMHQPSHVVVVKMREQDVGGLIGAYVRCRKAREQFAAVSRPVQLTRPSANQNGSATDPQEESVQRGLDRVR